MNKCKVIVYGSLKKGFHNHPLMNYAGAEFIDTAVSTTNDYLMCGVGSSFPGLLKGKSYFSGEVYSISQEGLEKYLDSLEGHPIFYKRELVDVTLDYTKEVVKAWVYILSNRYVTENYKRLNMGTPRLQFKNNIYTWSLEG